MKKTILAAFLSFACFAGSLTLVSCQDKTQEKLQDAGKAITEEVEASVDSAKIKAEAKLDTLKEKANAKIDSAKLRSAAKMEEAAKKLKESVKK
jgi:ElaB/YqjD/DUF883 family membrane-anchored ribosome-binding protein